jgi:hypothetical protein
MEPKHSGTTHSFAMKKWREQGENTGWFFGMVSVRATPVTNFGTESSVAAKCDEMMLTCGDRSEPSGALLMT